MAMRLMQYKTYKNSFIYTWNTDLLCAPFFPCSTLMNNNPRELFDLKGRIKGLDSKVNNAKSCDGSLGLLRVQISMTKGWIMVHGKSRDVIT